MLRLEYIGTLESCYEISGWVCFMRLLLVFFFGWLSQLSLALMKYLVVVANSPDRHPPCVVLCALLEGDLCSTVHAGSQLTIQAGVQTLQSD